MGQWFNKFNDSFTQKRDYYVEEAEKCVSYQRENMRESHVNLRVVTEIEVEFETLFRWRVFSDQNCRFHQTIRPPKVSVR